MGMVRTVSLIAAVLGVALVLAACGGKTGGTTTNPTEAAPRATTETGEATGEKEQTTTEKTSPEKAAPAEKTTTKEEAGGKANPAVKQGEQVFAANGCGSCHTLAAAGAGGAVGPNLDETLPGQSAASIRESIVDPNAKVATGYSAGIMPPTFGSTLSSSELEALVTFLEESAGK